MASRNNFSNHGPAFQFSEARGDITAVNYINCTLNGQADTTIAADARNVLTPTVTKNISKRMKELRINGLVIIFNQTFKNTISSRRGSDNDVDRLCHTFRRIGIEPIVKSDLKYQEIVKEIHALSRIDFSAYKLFVCIYMSHGDSNGIVSAADKNFNLKYSVIDPIMGNRSLNGIHKIFITVACRGDGSYTQCCNEEVDGSTDKKSETYILSCIDGIDYSNCITSYSTYEGHVSKRTSNGTYFIQSFCDIMDNINGHVKIHSIFAEVNRKLTQTSKQVPVFQSTMSDICLMDLATVQNDDIGYLNNITEFNDSICTTNKKKVIYRVKFESQSFYVYSEFYDLYPSFEEFTSAVKLQFEIGDNVDITIKDDAGFIIPNRNAFEIFMLQHFKNQQTSFEISVNQEENIGKSPPNDETSSCTNIIIALLLVYLIYRLLYCNNPLIEYG